MDTSRFVKRSLQARSNFLSNLAIMFPDHPLPYLPTRTRNGFTQLEMIAWESLEAWIKGVNEITFTNSVSIEDESGEIIIPVGSRLIIPVNGYVNEDETPIEAEAVGMDQENTDDGDQGGVEDQEIMETPESEDHLTSESEDQFDPESMTRDQLVFYASSHGIDIEPSGVNNYASKADYIKAITKYLEGE